MKKTLAMLMALTMTFALASCGSTDDDSSSADTEKSASTEDVSEEETEEDTEEETEEDTEEETEEETEKSTKAKKTTEAATEEETEDATVKKPSKPVMSTDVVGKWSMPKELIKEMDIDMSDAPEGMELGDMWIDITDTDIAFNLMMDISGVMHIDDKGFHMYEMTIENLENDGSTLKASMAGKEIASFKRAGSPDKSTVYGEYYAPEEWGSDRKDDMEYVIGFSAPGESYMRVTGSIGTYTYDEDSCQLLLKDEDGDAYVDVEINGDTMTWTSEEEEKTVTFERLD